jgi:hypothetical protein
LYRLESRSLLSWVLIGTLSAHLSASSSIVGVVSAEGRFQLNHREVADHATLLDDSVIESRETAPRLDLKDGTRVRFGPHSRGKISGHDVQLDAGIGEVGAANGYRLLVRTLRILPVRPQSVVRAQIAGDHRVVVAAYTAPANVYNGAGLLIATLVPDETLSFDSQPEAVTRTGCLLERNGSFIVATSEGTPKVIEARGTDLKKEVGNEVTIHGDVVQGATPAPCAGQVVELSGPAEHVANGCTQKVPQECANRLQTANRQTRPNAVLHGGHISPYVIGGIGVAAATIGAIAATRPSESNQ